MSTALLGTKADGALQRRVRNALFHYRFLPIDELQIESVDGHVTLRGTVTSYYARQVLVHGCLRIAGVREVIDEICVEPQRKRRADTVLRSCPASDQPEGTIAQQPGKL